MSLVQELQQYVSTLEAALSLKLDDDLHAASGNPAARRNTYVRLAELEASVLSSEKRAAESQNGWFPNRQLLLTHATLIFQL